MKHIKLFNENIENLYHKLINRKADEYIKDHEYEVISRGECRRILKIFNYKSLTSISPQPISFRFIFQRGDYPVVSNCKITKFEDCYWLVDIDDCFFLCDTIDGIKNLVYDLNNSTKAIWDFHLLMNEKWGRKE